jgi:hypothetical protein
MKISISVSLTVTLWAKFSEPDAYYKFPEAELCVVPLKSDRLCINFVTDQTNVGTKIEEVTKLIESRGGEIE